MTAGVFVYARISRDAKLTGLGVERQVDACKQLCAVRDFAEPTVIVDNDVSAYDLRRARPGWRQLNKLIESGAVDTLVAWHTDRLYRRLSDLEQLVSLLEAHPVDIVTVSSGQVDLSTASGRMTARILGSVSQHESEHKAERIVAAHAQLAAAGGWKGGPRPFGYEPDGVTVREDEADVAREAAARLLRGHSSIRVARWASGELHREVTARSLLRSLTSPHIAGKRLYWPRADRTRWASRRARGEVVGSQPATLIATHTVAGSWPAVLDGSTWNELVRRYPVGGSGRRRPRRSLLAGVLQCARCGKGLGWGESSADTASGRYATYRCLANSGGCGRLSIAADRVDGYVSELVVGAVASNRDQLRPTAAAPDSGGVRRSELAHNRSNIARALGDGLIDYGTFEVLVKAIDDELAAFDDQIPGATIAKEQRFRRAVSIAEAWDSADVDERREVIRTLVPRAWVYPVARGVHAPMDCRVAVQWVDEPDLSAEACRTRLTPMPASPSAAERRASRNARDRARRKAQRSITSGD